jgi:biopolymer transport protein ExbD
MAADVVERSPSQKPGQGLVRRPKRRMGIRIDMTPMVDVAFLLLIFFMVTTVFRRPLAMEVNMPEPGAKVEVPESNVMTVFVDQDETLYWRVAREDLQTVGWSEVGSLFAQSQQSNPDVIVLVKIHRQARYDAMVHMMDELDGAQMQRFSLIPMQPADQELVEGLR